jgi:hypothetical protein
MNEQLTKLIEEMILQVADELRKGDFEGHPFRGNQWTDGEGGSMTSQQHRAEVSYHQQRAEHHRRLAQNSPDQNARYEHNRIARDHEITAETHQRMSRFKETAEARHAEQDPRVEKPVVTVLREQRLALNTSGKFKDYQDHQDYQIYEARDGKSVISIDTKTGKWSHMSTRYDRSGQQEVYAEGNDAASLKEHVGKIPRKADVSLHEIMSDTVYDMYLAQLEKGDVVGHPFRGNQYSTEQVATLLDKHPEHHEAVVTVSPSKGKQERISGRVRTVSSKLREVQVKDKDAKARIESVKGAPHRPGTEYKTPEQRQDYPLAAAEQTSDFSKCEVNPEKTEGSMDLRKIVHEGLAEMRKGDEPGHPFRGNQYSDVAGHREAESKHREKQNDASLPEDVRERHRIAANNHEGAARELEHSGGVSTAYTVRASREANFQSELADTAERTRSDAAPKLGTVAEQTSAAIEADRKQREADLPAPKPTPKGPRAISEIARDISREWRKQKGGVNYAAKPYLDAMHSLESPKDSYGADSAQSILGYFLSNASSFKGPRAKELKQEIKQLLGRKKVESVNDLSLHDYVREVLDDEE